jgi:hypothetical protein
LSATGAGTGTGTGAGAADGGDDVLLAVEKLSEVMYFDVIGLLGQGSNGAVFKVGVGFALGLPCLACAAQSLLCPLCVLLAWLFACLF